MEILKEISRFISPEICFIDEELKEKQGGEIRYSCKGDCCFDIPSSEEIIIEPQEFKLVKTNLKINLKKYTELQIRSRSGFASKKGVFVLNSPGTIDEGYTGEIKIILANFSKETVKINIGDRIAQGKVSLSFEPKIEMISHSDFLIKAEKKTERSINGFGHSGV